MNRIAVLVLVVLAALSGGRIVAQEAPVRTVMTGSAFVYAVRAGDTLRTIGARFGVTANPETLAKTIEAIATAVNVARVPRLLPDREP